MLDARPPSQHRDGGRGQRTIARQRRRYDAINQWASLVRYIGDSRFAIDNGAAERAIRPLAVGRANWLQIGGDAGLKTASVLLSVCASARRHHLNPWAYLTHVLTESPTRSAGADLTDLLPDEWAKTRGPSRTQTS